MVNGGTLRAQESEILTAAHDRYLSAKSFPKMIFQWQLRLKKYQPQLRDMKKHQLDGIVFLLFVVFLLLLLLQIKSFNMENIFFSLDKELISSQTFLSVGILKHFFSVRMSTSISFSSETTQVLVAS